MQREPTTTIPLRLVERIVAGRGRRNDAPKVRILPGELPAELPLDLPSPPNSVLLGSTVASDALPGILEPRAKRATGVSIDVFLDVPATNVDILAFYHQALGERGWAPPAFDRTDINAYSDRRGFLAAPAPSVPRQIFCSGARGPWLQVTVYDGENGWSDVRVHVSTVDHSFCSARRPTTPGPLAIDTVVPALQSPPGVVMHGGNGSGSDTYWTTQATAETTLSAVELEAEFSAQLVDAGWKRRDSGANGALVWSTWTSVNEGTWQAVLWVLEEPEPDHRFLRLHLELLEADDPGG